MEFLFNVKSFFFKKDLIFFIIFSQEIDSLFVLFFSLLACNSLNIYAEIQKDSCINATKLSVFSIFIVQIFSKLYSCFKVLKILSISHLFKYFKILFLSFIFEITLIGLICHFNFLTKIYSSSSIQSTFTV
jgi:hypothetical protein